MATSETKPKPASRPDAALQFNTPFKVLADLKASLPEQPKIEVIHLTMREVGGVESVPVEVEVKGMTENQTEEVKTNVEL